MDQGAVMNQPAVSWKPDWEETKRHFTDWWNRTGMVLATHNNPYRALPMEPVDDPGPAPSIEYLYTVPRYRVHSMHYGVAHHDYILDNIPVPHLDHGPGSLAMFLGSEPHFTRDTVWYAPCMDPQAPESHPPLRFNPHNKWWKLTEETMRAAMERADGRYLVGFPDLIENIDILAAMRDPQRLLFDLIERPEWVEQKAREINQVWFGAFQRLYDIIRLPDGSSTLCTAGWTGIPICHGSSHRAGR